jgi:hypothetical protein
LLFERRIERKQSGRQVASSGSAPNASIRNSIAITVTISTG